MYHELNSVITSALLFDNFLQVKAGRYNYECG